MKCRIHTIIGLLTPGISLCFLVLTVLFSAGIPVNFRGILVFALLTAGGILSAASLIFAKPSGNLPKRIGFTLTHAGIVLLLAGFALFELAGDSITAMVPVDEESPTYYSNIQRENGDFCDLGFHFRADDWNIEYYEDGSQKQYSAVLSFADPVTLKIDRQEISVNHPVRRNGWKIYLMSFTYAAADNGSGQNYVNLILRRDPGEYIVKAGVFVLIAGTVLELLAGNGIRTKTKEDDHE